MEPQVNDRMPDALAPERFNASLARQFLRAADILEVQHADRHRVRAYRHAADALRHLPEPACTIYRRGGIPGLIALPAIGRSFALAIADVTETGRWHWLDRLLGQADPERLLVTIAGVGPGLASRLHHELGVESLEDLEVAAYDGRLGEMPGFGEKRVQSVRDSLAGRLARHGSVGPSTDEVPADGPSRAERLGIDEEYRREAAAGRLPTIVPNRFNPNRDRHLPVLHTIRGGHHYTAMYSNTPLAHQLGQTTDWVVIYADAPGHGQWTVLTEWHGVLSGQRVVRGLVSDRTDQHAN